MRTAFDWQVGSDPKDGKCNMNDAVPWIALSVSVLSAAFAGCAWWVSREKLRFDLYQRRFEIYLRTLDFWNAMSEWHPSEREKEATSLQDSKELRDSQRAFIKASREAQFLFGDKSGIHELLEQMNSDAIAIVGHKRDFAPKLEPELRSLSYKQLLEKQQRIDLTITELEQKLGPYLDFHWISSFNSSAM